MDVKNFSIADLKPYEKNPRKNDGAVDAVAKSIEQFGFKIPIVIDADNVIVCGHTRFKAAQKLGLDSVPCVVADDLSPEQIKAFRIVDNKTAELSKWVIEDLNAELIALTEFNMKDFGFDTSAIEGIDISPDDFSENFSLPTETNDQRKKFQITFLLHKKQAGLIRQAMNSVKESTETYEDTNRTGNLIYEIIRQWTEGRASCYAHKRFLSR